jgi:adhesin transport system membrane fusion protein
VKAAPVVAAGELALYESHKVSLAAQVDVLERRVEQRQRELSELAASLNRLTTDLKLANQELDIKKPLAERGLVAKTDLIRLQRDVAGLEGQISIQVESRSKMEAAIREAEATVAEQRQKYRQDARIELSQKEAELSVIEESLKGAKDRVVRADIKSPVDGIINKVNSNTVGGVVQAGQVLMEIVPIEESLFVEAKIRPSDIAFVHPSQPAVVKITAYDFSVYGGLEGEVERISADSVYDEVARESYYLVTVKTLGNQLKGKQESLPIIPGMVASVDILTGEKSVLQYLLKPINKARYEALTER